MKTLKAILFILIIFIAPNTNAQLLKKLMKKATEASERTLERKVEEKTETETEKAFDSTFNNQKQTKNEKSSSFNISASKVAPAANYNFSHKYVMQVKSDKNETILNYYLTNSGDYLASSVPDKNGNEDMKTVMDLGRKTMYMFMENKGDKSQMSMSLDLEEIADDAREETNVKVTLTGKTKTILGYKCEEYKVVGNDLNGTIWVAPNADISFSKSFYNIKAKKGMDQSWMKMINGLTLQMDMVDTSNRKPQTINMTCIALEKLKLNIHTSDYKKLI
ncbi:DUF4412 domain-containing protein [Yeosuana marina]|uniref:DUF4412 domain-containing protein n=1 Tax=Yeosuana marina TaxID=1565536 RepID=UPI0030ECA48D|tara:strand:- start:433 stop:1263 length:831 start_codon:yes stop_codon:yes gene_type:complete